MLPGEEPLADSELVYRRVPESYYPEPSEGKPDLLAFRPRKEDIRGISLARAKYISIETAARSGASKPFFVAVLQVTELRQAGLEVLPDPKEGEPSHCLIPQIRHDTKRDSATLEWQKLLAEKLCRMEGPFLMTDRDPDRAARGQPTTDG